jgi:DNA (cytosine-5)-methyltransferase 1
VRLLDLFCGAGGAAMGYHQAGFDEIVGVDIAFQPNYPFTFLNHDVFEPWVQRSIVQGEWDLVHASPPCQAYTTMNNRHGSTSPAYIAAIREPLSGRPYVLENVAGARREMVAPVELTGEMFGLAVHRPRLFELGGWSTLVPTRPRRQLEPVAVYGKPDGRRLFDRVDGTTLTAWSSLEEGQTALDTPWMTDELEVREAIPPAYTKFIGTQFLDQQENRK